MARTNQVVLAIPLARLCSRRSFMGDRGTMGHQPTWAGQEILADLFLDLGESSYGDWDYQQSDVLLAFMNQRMLAAISGQRRRSTLWCPRPVLLYRRLRRDHRRRAFRPSCLLVGAVLAQGMPKVLHTFQARQWFVRLRGQRVGHRSQSRQRRAHRSCCARGTIWTPPTWPP